MRLPELTRKRLHGAAALAVLPLTLAACGSGASRSAVLERYECTQTHDLALLADHAAALRFGWSGVNLDAQVASLRLPALRPVPLAGSSGKSRPWQAMSEAQRDTFAAWQALDGGEVIGDARDSQGFFSTPAPVSSCKRPALPKRRGTNTSSFEGAVDRVVRGDRSGEALEAVLSKLSAGRVRQLEESAFAGPTWLAYDGDADGLLGASSPDGVRFSTSQVAALLLALAPDGPRWKRFLGALAEAQARAVERGTAAGTPKTDTAWAGPIGAIDGVVTMAAFRSGKAATAAAVALGDAVVADLAHPGSGASQLDRQAPSYPIDAGVMRNDFHFALAAGYANADDPSTPAHLLRDGHMPPPDTLRPIVRAELEDWIGNHLEGTKRALAVADLAFDDRVLGCCKESR